MNSINDSQPIINLNGRSALVTGSTLGIGRCIADTLRAAGAVVTYHGLEPVDDLPIGAPFIQADLVPVGASAQVIEEAFMALPELDVLVCNAGSFFDVPFLEMTPELWEKTLALNGRQTYFLIQAFARRLIEQSRSGSVVILSSTNGFQAEYDSTAYDTSKGALVQMTRSLALNLAEYGIRVNSVAPGLIRTPFTQNAVDENHAYRGHYEHAIPLGRIGTPEECAGAAAFLVSSAAAYITGQILIVDGGLTVSQISRM